MCSALLCRFRPVPDPLLQCLVRITHPAWAGLLPTLASNVQDRLGVFFVKVNVPDLAVPLDGVRPNGLVSLAADVALDYYLASHRVLQRLAAAPARPGPTG